MTVKWVELAKFSVGVVLAALIVVVGSLLSAPAELDALGAAQAQIVVDMTGSDPVGAPARGGDPRAAYAVYGAKNGGSVVFLDSPQGRLAVAFDAAQSVKDCRWVTAPLPPRAYVPARLAELAAAGALDPAKPDPQTLEARGLALAEADRRTVAQFADTLRRAADLSRKAGKQ